MTFQKNLIRSFLLSLSVLISFNVFAGPIAEITTQQELDQYISMSSFNGVILVAKDEEILIKKAYGYKNIESKIPLTTTDRFQIGSNTKQFVSASILKLQEEGKLSLDDSLTKYFPQYLIYDGINIRDILNHSAGIPNFTDIEEFWNTLDYNKSLTLDELIDFTAKYPLDFAPKSNWNYSNTGYILAGKIIEMVSGKSWDEYINENFLQPLQMSDTGYSELFETASDVSGHLRDESTLKPSNEFNLSWAQSAGALYSNVDDLLTWTTIYDSSNLISDESKKIMQTPFLNKYALGLVVSPFQDDVRITHNGRTPGFVSHITSLKKSKLKVIALDNIDGDVSGIPELLLAFFYKGKASAIKLDAYPISAEKLQEYVGTYAADSLIFEITTQDDQLLLTTNGQPPYNLLPNDKDCFRIGVLAAEEFIRNENGIVIGIKHYQNGKILNFAKN